MIKSRIGLVGCAKMKRDSERMAKELYCSPLFMKRVKYVEKHYDDWFILSTKYHLLNPRKVIRPYDKSMKGRSTDQSQKWSRIVYDAIIKRFPNPSRVTLFVHAGQDYWENLVPLLQKSGYNCEIPLKGLRIGEQLRCYSKRDQESHARGYIERPNHALKGKSLVKEKIPRSSGEILKT